MSKSKFFWEYRAPTPEEREKIGQLRAQYATEEVALSRLRRLDARVRRLASAAAFLMGAAGVLLFGAGLSMVLAGDLLFGGSAVALLGALPVAAAYPVYERLLRHGKKKYAKEILQLSDALLREEHSASENGREGGAKDPHGRG